MKGLSLKQIIPWLLNIIQWWNFEWYVNKETADCEFAFALFMTGQNKNMPHNKLWKSHFGDVGRMTKYASGPFSQNFPLPQHGEAFAQDSGARLRMVGQWNRHPFETHEEWTDPEEKRTSKAGTPCSRENGHQIAWRTPWLERVFPPFINQSPPSTTEEFQLFIPSGVLWLFSPFPACDGFLIRCQSYYNDRELF